MRVELLVPHRLSKRKARSAQEPLVDVVDDVRSIFRGVCGEIAGQAQFVIAGFGQDPWPVELQRDLPVLLEHLPRTLAAVSSSEPVVLDFSGRGLERRLRFSPLGDFYSVACTSREEWQPDPDIALLERVALQRMLLRVRDEFMRSMRAVAPGLADDPRVQEWLLGERDRKSRL